MKIELEAKRNKLQWLTVKLTEKKNQMAFFDLALILHNPRATQGSDTNCWGGSTYKTRLVHKIKIKK